MTSDRISTFEGDGKGPKVAVLGGGVAGMSAAHELIERGFRVAVFERQTELCGGKARSIPVPVGGDNSICGDVEGLAGFLPGEHGFRFFPRFYRHVTDTMSRIPFGDKGAHVVDNLTDTSRVEMSLYDKKSIEMPSRFPSNREDWALIVKDLAENVPAEMGLKNDEIEFFVGKLWQVLTSCDARRQEVYETMGWWDFVDASNKSEGYQKFLAEGLTRSLVAANARLANAHVEGDVGLALILDMLIPGPSTDRVLNGPTNEVWLHPWLAYLTKKGVDYQFDRKIEKIVCKPDQGSTGGKIESVVMSDSAGNSYTLEDADYYIAAMPAEVMAKLLDDGILDADSSLEGIKEIGTKYVEWMNGIQFYLNRGHAPVQRAHHLYRLAVGHHLHLPATVLARSPSREIRKRDGARDHLGRHLELARRRQHDHEASHVLHRRGDQDRGMGGAEKIPRDGREATDRRDVGLLVPRPRHPAGEMARFPPRRGVGRGHRSRPHG